MLTAPLAIETDTDGTYFQWNDAWDLAKLEKDVDAHIKKVVKRWAVSSERRLEWGIDPDIKMEMDSDLYIAGWFYKQKSYILLTECHQCKGTKEVDGGPCIACDEWGTQLKIKGGTFRSKRNCLMFDTVRDKLARLRMIDASRLEVLDAIRGAMAIDRWPIKQLTLRLQLSKPIELYHSSYWGVKIARRAERLLSIKPKPFFQYEFIYANTNDGIELTEIAEPEVVDVTKYREIVCGIAERFGWLELALPFMAGNVHDIEGGW